LISKATTAPWSRPHSSGYRLIVATALRAPFTRRGYDSTDRYSPIAAVAGTPAAKTFTPELCGSGGDAGVVEAVGADEAGQHAG
jgi:hypothetical protein